MGVSPKTEPMRGARGERSPAQLFALVAGLTLVAVGLIGFAADSSFTTGADVDGGSLIGFEVNGLHNIVHILSGLLLLAGYRRPGSARFVCTVFGVTYGAVTVIGLIDGEDVLGLFPVNPADNVLHIGLTVLALGFAATQMSDRDPAADRRLL
jgi:Domain of unknown function (DUF4383)